MDIKANSQEINKRTKDIILEIVDTTSAEIKAYKPTSIKEALEDLEEDKDFIIIGLTRHKYRDGFKYVLNIEEDKPEAEPNIYKSSYFMEQILNTLDIGDHIPFLKFKQEL